MPHVSSRTGAARLLLSQDAHVCIPRGGTSVTKLGFHWFVVPVLIVCLVAVGCESASSDPTAPVTPVAPTATVATPMPAETPPPLPLIPTPTVTPTPMPTATPTATPPPTLTPEPLVIRLNGAGQDVRIMDNMPTGLYTVSVSIKDNETCFGYSCSRGHFSVRLEGAESGSELVANEVASEWSGTSPLRIGDGLFDIPPGTVLVTISAESGSDWEIVISEL